MWHKMGTGGFGFLLNNGLNDWIGGQKKKRALPRARRQVVGPEDEELVEEPSFNPENPYHVSVTSSENTRFPSISLLCVSSSSLVGTIT